MSTDSYNPSYMMNSQMSPPSEENTLSSSSSSSTTGSQQMSTVVGETTVPTESYGVSGEIVNSSGDTPLDVNKMQGAVVTEEATVLPSTGTGFITDTPIPSAESQQSVESFTPFYYF